MSGYFSSRVMYRHPLQEKAVPLIALSIFTLFSAAGVLLFFSGRSQESAPAEPRIIANPDDSVEVLVPLRDIEENTPLDPGLFRIEKRSIAYVSPRIVRSMEAVHNQFARSFIAAGEPLHSGYLSARQLSPGEAISKSIPKGSRVTTIRVDDTQAGDGIIRPGSIVDVSWVRSLAGVPSVSFIVQNAKVLLADRQIDPAWKPGMPTPGTITLLVTAEDFKKMELAKTVGKVGLALRGTDGVGYGDIGGLLTIRDLNEQKTAPPPPVPCQNTVSVCESAGNCSKLCMQPDGKLSPAAAS